jgi:hypothetical protein
MHGIAVARDVGESGHHRFRDEIVARGALAHIHVFKVKALRRRHRLFTFA